MAAAVRAELHQHQHQQQQQNEQHQELEWEQQSRVWCKTGWGTNALAHLG